MDTSDRIKNLIAKFVLNYNYWGYLFSRIRSYPDLNLPSIMGVAPELDGTISLYYHPVLVDKTDDYNLSMIIKHEGLHLLNKHVSRLLRIISNEVSEEQKNRKAKIWNYAADFTVNSQANFKTKYIVVAGENWPLQLPENYELPRDKITEWYYLQLLKNQSNMKKLGLPDQSHDKWLKNVQSSSDIGSLSRKIEQHIQRIVKESAKSFNKKRGRLPGNIASLIEGILAPPKAPYYQIIRKLVRGTRFSKFQRSPTKINRKRTYSFLFKDKNIPQISPFPGKKRDYTFDIVILLDASGSMTNDEIREGLSGIKNIIEKDRNCYTTVLEVDTVVQKEYICKKVHDIQFKVKGRGGTTLGPGLFRAKELGCDVCLAFTDGGTENINNYPRKKLPKKIIWVITKNGISTYVNKTGYVVQL